ncbi:MAG: hypothetical protein CK529_07310 [Rhodospirillaceae bacterium]|nr:MAG: hypothetical protein CK529_07310 [Rhodospirillaceae bacterium]
MDRFADVAAAMAGQDDVQAMSAGLDDLAQPTPMAAAPHNTLDFGAAVKTGNSEQMTVSWFIMQELSRMIATQPMSMVGDEEDSESTTSLSVGGFQGEGMSQVLVDSMARNNLPPSQSSAITLGQATRAYNGTSRR